MTCVVLSVCLQENSSDNKYPSALCLLALSSATCSGHGEQETTCEKNHFIVQQRIKNSCLIFTSDSLMLTKQDDVGICTCATAEITLHCQ